MFVLNGLTDWPWSDAVVTMGVFDGVHLGHRALLDRTVVIAAEHNWRPVALTFEPHPEQVLRPDAAPALLTTTQEKLNLLAESALWAAVVARFDPHLATMEPEEFVLRILIGRLAARHIVIGHRARFGRGGRGEPALLRRVAESAGVGVECVGPVTVDGEEPSSTLIRRLLQEGEIDRANHLLGRRYRVTGEIVHGDGRGRLLGCPTANVAAPAGRLLPGNGVYAALAVWEGETRPAVVNIGRRPTFGGNGVTVEAHLPGFSGDLYGRRLALDFVAFLRPEQQFADTESLCTQIAQDAQAALALLRPSPPPPAG